MEDWREKLERPATRLEVGGFRPTERRGVSSFGRITLSRPGEIWPAWHGRPLLPLCQLNVADAPYTPPSLRDVSLVCIFVTESLEDLLNFNTATVDDETDHPWHIRTYETLDGLVELGKPDFDSPIRPFEARWQEVEQDYPTHDLIPIELPPEVDEDYYGIEGVRTIDGTKLGGWPGCIQSEPWWDYDAAGAEFEYALQVDSEEKARWMWGDSGAAYFARSKSDPTRWALDWQCY